MLTPDEMKQRVGIQATQLVEPGMTIGLGSGSTMYWFITALSERVREGLTFTAVPTSSDTEKLAKEKGMVLKTPNEVEQINLTIDGADEIDPQWQLIKGGGGALLQEKLVAAFSEKLVIIADHSKLVPQLGRFPLPVEVIPYAWKHLQQRLTQLYKIPVALRKKNGAPFLTDHGHYILDCQFGVIGDAPTLHYELKQLPGIVETGLFINMVHAIHIGYPDGSVRAYENNEQGTRNIER